MTNAIATATQTQTQTQTIRTRNDRRLGALPTTQPTPRPDPDSIPPRVWPKWALLMRQEYESKLAAAQRRINELESAIMQTEKANRIADNTRALAAYGSGDDVKGLTNRLTYMLPNANEIGTPGVALVAQIAIAHGLDPLPGADHLYAWKQRNKRTGKDEVQVVIGYKGLLHLARKQTRFTYQSRPMTPDERAEHGIADQPAAVGYVTTLYILADAIECQKAGIPYYPLVGTAVWRPGDEVPRGRTPAWVAKKNSLKDALRQVVTTGVRLQEALDNALQQFGQQLGGVEYTGEGWRAEVDEPDAQALIEAGVVPPDDDGPEAEAQTVQVIDVTPDVPQQTGSQDVPPQTPQPAAPPLCRNCQIEPADPSNPVDPILCSTCARNVADAQAAAQDKTNSQPATTTPRVKPQTPPRAKPKPDASQTPQRAKPKLAPSPVPPTPQRRSVPDLRDVANRINGALQIMADNGVEIKPVPGWGRNHTHTNE